MAGIRTTDWFLDPIRRVLLDGVIRTRIRFSFKIQQWKLRMMALEAALGEAAYSRLRRLLANNKPFKCTDVQIGDAALL